MDVLCLLTKPEQSQSHISWMALVSCSFMKATHPPSRSQNSETFESFYFKNKTPETPRENGWEMKKSKKVTFSSHEKIEYNLPRKVQGDSPENTP